MCIEYTKRNWLLREWALQLLWLLLLLMVVVVVVVVVKLLAFCISAVNVLRKNVDVFGTINVCFDVL
jgi:hypothetical protein